MSTRDGFLEQIKEAKISVAKMALANPGMSDEGCELMAARRSYTEAKARLKRAEVRWKEVIAPAGNWAPDPLKEK